MAEVRRVRRLVNPRKHRRKAKARGNPKHRRRRLTAAQIRAGFGGKRAKSALRGRRRHRANPKRRHTRRKNASAKTRVKTIYRTRTVRRSKSRKRKHNVHRRRSSNPGLLITYGPAALNPRRRHKMAKSRRRRKVNAHRRHHRRRSNPVKVVYRYRSKKRHNARGHRRRRRSNPIGFGRGHGIAATGKAIIFGLAGVTATKAVANMGFIAQFTASPLMRVVVSTAVAWGGGILVGKWDREAGDAFMFGGLMQAGSVALNAFLPSVGNVIGLSGLRALTPSNDIGLPYNPFAGRGAVVPASAAMNMGGGAFPPPFA